MKLIRAGLSQLARRIFCPTCLRSLAYRPVVSFTRILFTSQESKGPMEQIVKLKEEINSLDQKIESQVRLLSKKLEKTDKIEDLEDCAAELTRLIDKRRFKNDMLIWLTTGGEAQSSEAARQG
jgi:hypothetical protein